MRILWCVCRYSPLCVCVCVSSETGIQTLSRHVTVGEYGCLVYSIFLCTLQTGGRVRMINVGTLSLQR